MHVLEHLVGMHLFLMLGKQVYSDKANLVINFTKMCNAPEWPEPLLALVKQPHALQINLSLSDHAARSQRAASRKRVRINPVINFDDL